MLQFDTTGDEYVEMVGDVDHRIIMERNESIRVLHQDMDIITDTWNYISSMIYDQGEQINIMEEHIEATEINTKSAAVNLEKSFDLIRDRLIIIRDIALIIGGGILGTGGFLLGPIIGVGTAVAGSAAGGAVAAGLHKISKDNNIRIS